MKEASRRAKLSPRFWAIAALAVLGSPSCGSHGGPPSPQSAGGGSDGGADGAAVGTDASSIDAGAPSKDGGEDTASVGSDAGAPDSGSTTTADGATGAVAPPPLASGCSQSLADGTMPPSTTSYIYPPKPIVPFYQWLSNNGYCGEVSMIQAGLANGQWTSQYNARLLCGGVADGTDGPKGAPLLQSGPDAGCDQNAQLLLDSVSSDSAPTCLSNFGLANELFDYSSEASGTAGYQAFMSWVKSQTIAGSNVTVGVLSSDGSDSEYDHIVSVVKIGTNHGVTDSTYYDDDVLYFDDHGVITFENGAATSNPSVPPGTGSDTKGCTPYIFGYTFAAMGQTASAAHSKSAQSYSIVIPGSGKNYGFAVSGPASSVPDAGLLPVTLQIIGSETTGTANVDSPLAGYNYENPYIGTSDDGSSCTNSPPSSFMTLSLLATVSGLTAGVHYNLYEYDFATVSGNGTAAALAVPTSAWNANASHATATVPFTASGPSFSYALPPKVASQTILLRAVPASAP